MTPNRFTTRQGGHSMASGIRRALTRSFSACRGGSFVIAAALVCSSFAVAAGPQWHTSFEEAVTICQTSDLPIVAFFTGSDWCPHCKTLEKKVLHTKAFAEWAEGRVVLLEIDMPQDGLSREERAERSRICKAYGVRSFPSVLLIGPDGSVLHRQAGYSGQSAPHWIGMFAEHLPGTAETVAGKPDASSTRR